jgi:hypothetical protein
MDPWLEIHLKVPLWKGYFLPVCVCVYIYIYIYIYIYMHCAMEKHTYYREF